MLMLQCILLSCLFGFLAGHANHSAWYYKDPDGWKADYPLCGESKQSPINIVKSKTKYDSSISERLTFLKYDSSWTGIKLLIKNTGKTLNVYTPPLDASINIKGIGDCKLYRVQFHWGSVDSKGSEHQIDGKVYSAELHLIHYNKKYESYYDARKESDGIAIVAVMIEKGAENEGFKKFLNLEKYNVTTMGVNATVDAFKMSSFLPKNRTLFYWYGGSFTSPSCYPTVLWIVCDSAIQISEDQLAEFRKLKGKDNMDLVNNVRPLQNLGNRTVFASLDLSPSDPSPSDPSPSDPSPSDPSPSDPSPSDPSSSGGSLKVSIVIVFLFVISSFIV